ncbi:MAG: hypothetical protein WCX16_06100, partial [Candidatus Omnitrophota bacterium]
VASSGLSFKQHAKNLIDVITPRSSLEQLKEVYGNLGNVHPFSSAAEAVYNAVTSNTRMDVLTASDISQVADIFVAEFVKEFQTWQTSADSQENIIIHFATGATPWISYRKLADILETWETPQTQEFLRRAGVDATQKPDMTRVEAYCLDAILPQKRTDYHAFANKLNNVWDLLRIPQDQRHLLYGDLIMQQGQPRPATEKEFESLMQDVKQNGFQLKKYKAGKLAMESIQYKFFKAIEQEAQAMSGNLTQQGGGHIVIWGVGPSYEGKGHLAFMEEGTPIDQKVFLDNAGFFVQADHAKENGGFDNMAQLGFVTLGFYELLYRQNAKHILLATSNSKRNAIYKAVEGKSKEDFSRFPVTALQDQRGVVIASGGADANLRLKRHFWHYELIDEWTPEMIRQMFVRLADDISKPLLSLEENDFFALDVGHPMINRIREENLKSLKRQGSFEELKQQVAKGITQNILNPYDFPEKLGWKAGEKKNVVIINPHLDDDYLAGIAHLLKENSSFIGNAEVYYTAKGITAVSDSYVGQILEHMRSWDQAKILSVLAKTDKDIALEIIPILEKQNLHTDAEDYDVWTQMSAQEKDLRAQTLFLDAMREFMPQDDNVDSLNDVIDFLQAVMATKPSWGARDIDLLTTIKEVIRVFENRTALMSLGFAFENIHAPMDSTWYGQEGRGTAKEQDIERIQKILREKRPDLIISNGEGFSDYGAHSTTEASVIAAMENLFEEGVLDVNKIHYLTYAGVWDRTKLSDEDVLSIVMTTETLSLLDQGFRQHYPSQSPAPVPDPGFGKPTFFSKAVFANARISRSEIRRLFPEYFKDHLILSQEGSGVLNYRLINLKDPLTQQRLIDKVKELKRVRDDLARSSDFVINGPAPLPDLLTKDRKRFQLFLTALSLTEEEILSGIKPGDIASSQEVSNELPKISSGLTAKVYRPEDALQKMLVDGFVELKTAEGNKIKFTFQEISSKGYRIFAYEGDKKLGYCDFQKNEIAIGHYQAEAIMVFTTAGYSGLGRAMMSLVLAFAKAQGLESFGAPKLSNPCA